MTLPALRAHPWELSPAEAIALQQELRGEVRLEALDPPPRWVAGVDVAFPNHGATAQAAAALFRLPGLEPAEQAVARRPVSLPYIPGLLSFRELPAVIAALQALSHCPELVLCDGQGIAHPRRLGVASHLGVISGLPTIGVGKSRLVGRHDPPGPNKGDRVPLMDGDERIGTVLRTRTRVRPLYISPGHRVNFEDACHWVLACTGQYRLPEPIRMADRLAGGKAVAGGHSKR